MKLWLKIFIGTLIIFIFAFNAGVLYLTIYSYNFNRQTETDNSIREQEIIKSTVTGRLANAESFFPDAPTNSERLVAIIDPLANFYSPQGVLLTLYYDGLNVYGDIPNIRHIVFDDVANVRQIESELLNLDNTQSKNIVEVTIDGKRHVLVASKLPDYPHLTLLYARDISQVDIFRTIIGRVFAIINIFVLSFLGISIYLLLKHITKPISKLTTVTVDMANGAYEKRVDVNSSDELGVLADSFNRMADSIEEQMSMLKKSAEDKQQFIDDLTHEIKTPMTSILGYSEYLHSAKSTEEERIVAAAHLYDMTLRLEALSEKLLDLAYSRDENIEWETVYVPGLFDELTMMMHPKLAPRNLELLVFPELTYITGDKMLILLMLQNLVENAAKASNDGAVITMRTHMEDHPVIEVRDTGCGMEKHDVERIMAPFYRVDKSRSRKHGGVGLGLSIVSQIAALHDARVEIESEPGFGTIVKIILKSRENGLV